MVPSSEPRTSDESYTEGGDEDEDRLNGERSGGLWVEGEGELKGRSRSETVSLAAQLIARLVGLSTSRRPAPVAKTATHGWPQERWKPGQGRSRHGQHGSRHGYANVRGSQHGGNYNNGWHRSSHLRPWQYEAAQWRKGGNPLGKVGYGHFGHGNYHHGRHGYYHPQGYGQMHGQTKTIPRMNHRLPSMNQQLPRAQAPSLHGLHPQGLRHNNLPRVQPPHFNDMKIPQGPQMPNNKALPRMYSPGMPNSKLTLDMLGRMLKEGKIPPINFNCNSNNHILHLVKQNSREDDKKKKKRRRKRRAVEESGSYSKENSGEENLDDDNEKKTSIEGKSIIPLLKRVEAKDVHALSHQLQPAQGYGYGRPVIHHHGPRVILVCISNTYLQTLIKENSGSDSD